MKMPFQWILRENHVVIPPIGSEEDIGQMFDLLVYKKGRSILQFITSMIGEDVYVLGLSKYLKAHTYQNSVTLDLWSALGRISKFRLSRVDDAVDRNS
jgi:aminopeptidase N